MKFPSGAKKAATLIVLQSDSKLLLLKRKKSPNQGLYTPVGGKLEPYEDPLEAAKRETMEETGMDPEELRFCGILTESSPTEYNWISYVYHGFVPYQPAPSCNEGELAWIDIDDISDIPTPKTDEFIYNYILRDKRFVFKAIFNQQLQIKNMYEELENRLIYSSDL